MESADDANDWSGADNVDRWTVMSSCGRPDHSKPQIRKRSSVMWFMSVLTATKRLVFVDATRLGVYLNKTLAIIPLSS